MNINRSTLRKITVLFLSLTLCWTTVACGGGNTVSNTPVGNQSAPARTVSSRISAGEYPVQQARYNDANGEYSLMLLNTPPGTPANFRTTDLQMAQLTPEEISAGKKSYLKVENNGQTSLHIPEDFKIEYIRAVTETRPDPQTGQPQTVIVRQESGGFWAPFAGAVAGNLVGNMLFAPRYYVPPVYQPGMSVMTGYGGYGNTYSQATTSYQQRYNQPPAAVRNRPAYIRTTGALRNYPSSSGTFDRPRSTTPGQRATGSGFGSSTLRQSGRSAPSSGGTSSFGSGGRSRSTSGFGSRSGGFGRRR
ncbi:hypothetical protein [Floridanema aerugineum]|uniref:Uncharacterized protein n=1 Tax=Floridaenema aerugineum BLCC-F46 TaxID=3153654 RepID=A0ABV4X5R3_9CYAN